MKKTIVIVDNNDDTYTDDCIVIHINTIDENYKFPDDTK